MSADDVSTHDFHAALVQALRRQREIEEQLAYLKSRFEDLVARVLHEESKNSALRSQFEAWDAAEAELKAIEDDQADERDALIATINCLCPADSNYRECAEIGQRLLHQARLEALDWRDEPIEVLRVYARLCRNQELGS